MRVASCRVEDRASVLKDGTQGSKAEECTPNRLFGLLCGLCCGPGCARRPEECRRDASTSHRVTDDVDKLGFHTQSINCSWESGKPASFRGLAAASPLAVHPHWQQGRTLANGVGPAPSAATAGTRRANSGGTRGEARTSPRAPRRVPSRAQSNILRGAAAGAWRTCVPRLRGTVRHGSAALCRGDAVPTRGLSRSECRGRGRRRSRRWRAVGR